MCKRGARLYIRWLFHDQDRLRGFGSHHVRNLTEAQTFSRHLARPDDDQVTGRVGNGLQNCLWHTALETHGFGIHPRHLEPGLWLPLAGPRPVLPSQRHVQG